MHLLVIFGIALLVFGPKKLPELGKGIGEGIRGFKSAMREEEKPAVPPTVAAGDHSCPGCNFLAGKSSMDPAHTPGR